MITPPKQGEPVDELWRTVAKLANFCNSLEKLRFEQEASQAKLVVVGSDTVILPRKTGSIVMGDGDSTLVVR